jgi:acetyl-CoA C-acetyltransferase
MADNTPIIVGVGQFTERLDQSDYQGLSPQDLAAQAARRALEDTGASAGLLALLDAVAAVRTVGDSVVPQVRKFMAPFGGPDNFPRAVAQRLGCNPALAIYSPACGDEPQKLTGEFCERILTGEIRAALVVGAEAIATQRKAQAEKRVLDWNEEVAGSLEDRGRGTESLKTRHMSNHNMEMPPSVYPLFDHARRHRLGLSREAYTQQMSELFSAFSQVAAENPYAMAPTALSVEEIAVVDERNRMIADPYTKSMVARDWVNQGAAVVLTSEGVARELGIPQDKWVYLHGYADVAEKGVLEREDLGASPAMKKAYSAALSAARVDVKDIEFFDLYSCFPIAVLAACDALGISPHHSKPLTVTGGLPFFGGPGNNYSMHAIASIVEKLRANPGTYGVVGANGGYLSKHSVGVFSTKPVENWRPCDSVPLQEAVDRLPVPAFNHEPEGWASIETYTLLYGKSGAETGVVVGRLEATGERFIAMTATGDSETLERLQSTDPLAKRIFVRSFGVGCRFAFSREHMEVLFPRVAPAFRASYEHCIVERRGHVLEVTINNPDAHNTLNPYANDELEAVFDAYMADKDLWVAIITGAGAKAFCTGNDLKFTASGKKGWMPKTGFAGLTARANRNKPVIAAVNGFAMGGGFEIALACDMIMAAENAVFALTEVRVGLIAGAGGLQRLTRQIPKKLATEMILTGRRVSAQEGCELGFVNQVVPAGEALAAARKLADTLLECSPTSIRASLEILEASEHFSSATESVRQRYDALDRLLNSEDMMEGVTAFATKRAPQWKNR